MRLTKDHICEIRGDREYWFDLNRTVLKDSIVIMPKSELIDLISVSFGKMYAMDNRKREQNRLKPIKYCYVSHTLEGYLLKITIKKEIE